jgi:hypothetical protein
MKTTLAAAFVVSSLVAGLAAQADQQKPTQGQQPSGSTPAKVTISGCLQTAPAPTGTPAVPSTPTTAKFELTNAKVVSSSPVGTTGTAAAATRYRLEGEDKTISPHLNQQVDITGTVSPAMSTATPDSAAAPTLKVESLKMVAMKCQ